MVGRPPDEQTTQVTVPEQCRPPPAHTEPTSRSQGPRRCSATSPGTKSPQKTGGARWKTLGARETRCRPEEAGPPSSVLAGPAPTLFGRGPGRPVGPSPEVPGCRHSHSPPQPRPDPAASATAHARRSRPRTPSTTMHRPILRQRHRRPGEDDHRLEGRAGPRAGHGSAPTPTGRGGPRRRPRAGTDDPPVDHIAPAPARRSQRCMPTVAGATALA